MFRYSTKPSIAVVNSENRVLLETFPLAEDADIFSLVARYCLLQDS